MRHLAALLLAVPVLAAAALPTYTLIDLGPANDPNGTVWPDAECQKIAAGKDGSGHPLYSCREWDWSASATLDSYYIWGGYAQLAVSDPTRPVEVFRRPVEYFESCCGKPPPFEGLMTLLMPKSESTAAGAALSISQGGEYTVGYAAYYRGNSSGRAGLVRHAVAWDREVPASLPALAGTGAQFDSAAYAANEWGEFVGESEIRLSGAGYASRATIWIARVPHELQYMLAPYVPLVLVQAGWIDCAGNVGALGWPLDIGLHPYSTNYPHAYLLKRNGAARQCIQ